MNDPNASTNAIAALISQRAQHIPVPSGSLIAVRRRASRRRTHQHLSVGAAGLALVGGTFGAIQLRSDRTPRIVVTDQPPIVTSDEPAREKTQLASDLEINSTGPAVVALQERLGDLGFDPGPADGYFGFGTRQAVWAFEKLVLNTPASEATGRVTNEMWQTMQGPIVIVPRREKAVTYNQRPTHVEIYLDTQILIVFTDDKPVLITHISSGSGETWCELITYSINEKGEPLPEPRTADECGESKTPGGVFSFYLHYEGVATGPLGQMWNPVFFNYGIAVYGSEEVPLHPASHGGIRISNFIADYFPSLVENTDRVYVWDGIKEPEEYSRDEKRAPANFPNPVG